MFKLLGAILGLIPAVLFGILLFIINPILGILWVIWMTLVVIWVVRKDIIMKWLGWLFGAKK